MDDAAEILASRVAGMTCAHCKRAIEDELVGLKGITQVVVDLNERLVTVHAGGLEPRSVEAAIERAGYSATCIRRDPV